MITYLACPYSHHSSDVRLMRFDMACRAAAKLMREGKTVFSPISHSHPVAAYLPEELLLSWPFWKAQDFPLLDLADELVVLTLPGWEESRGVKAEIERAKYWNIPILYMEPDFD